MSYTAVAEVIVRDSDTSRFVFTNRPTCDDAIKTCSMKGLGIAIEVALISRDMQSL